MDAARVGRRAGAAVAKRIGARQTPRERLIRARRVHRPDGARHVEGVLPVVVVDEALRQQRRLACGRAQQRARDARAVVRVDDQRAALRLLRRRARLHDDRAARRAARRVRRVRDGHPRIARHVARVVVPARVVGARHARVDVDAARVGRRARTGGAVGVGAGERVVEGLRRVLGRHRAHDARHQ